ncbi:MAG: hypothetical protein WCT05_07705 [Lentisphaeria bacterium]
MTMTLLSIPPLLDRPFLRFLFAVLVLVFLHLPFSFLSITSGRNSPEESGIRLPTVVSLPPVSSPYLSTFERDLYQWVSIADPRRMLHPDLQSGFSRFGNPTYAYPPPPLPVWSLQKYFWPKTDYPESRLAVAGKSLRELILEQWNKDSKIFLLPFEKATLPSGVFWRLAGSKTQISNLELPPEFSVLAGNPLEVGKITRMTLLELAMLKGLPIPRIVVRRSCGNIQFDRLAVVALKRHLQAAKKENTVFFLAENSANKTWYLEVDWRLSKMGEEP